MSNDIIIECLKSSQEIEGFFFPKGEEKHLTEEEYKKLTKEGSSYKAMVSGGFLKELTDNQVSQIVEVEKTKDESNKKINSLKDQHSIEIDKLKNKHAEEISLINKQHEKEKDSIRVQISEGKERIKKLEAGKEELQKNMSKKIQSLEQEVKALKFKK